MEKKNFDFENLGPKIKELRIREGLSQKDVAEALGVTPGYISNVENSRTAMSLRVLSYFAKLTGITLDALVGSIEPDYKPTALDHELQQVISKLGDAEKTKILETIRIWGDKQ